MHSARWLLPVMLTFAAAGCARQQQQAYLIDPATGRAVPVVMQQPAQPVYAQQTYQPPAAQAAPNGERGLFTSWQSAPQPQALQQMYQQPPYPQQAYQAPPPSSGGRGLFTAPASVPPVYAQAQQPYAMQYGARYAQSATGGPYIPAPQGSFAAAALY